MPNVVIHPESGLPQAVCAVLWRPADRSDHSEGTLLATSRRHQATLGMIGGKHDVGETAEEALVREINEESGVVVDPASLMVLYAGVCQPENPGGQAYWCITYLAPMPTGQVARCQEPGIEPVHVNWAELLARGAFQDYDHRVYQAFLAHQAQRARLEH